MARQIRRFGRWLLGLGALAGMLFLLLPPHRPARAATFTSPIWTLSATLECPCSCDCNRPPNTSPEGVNYISTALNEGFFVASMPGVREAV